MAISKRRLCSNGGFTLIELLVVISVIGLLTGLLLPAVMAARGAARKAQCASNLHQLGIALHQYHKSHREFPIGCIEPRCYNRRGRQLAWSIHLLPFLEQTAVYDMVDLKKPYYHSANKSAAANLLPIFLCPSHTRDDYYEAGRAVCDYGGIFGERLLSNNSPPNGTMLYDQPISLREIVDGATHTIILSEDCKSQDMQWINGQNIFEQMYPINKAPAGENEISSMHLGGGAHALNCDGAVRFLSESIDLNVLAAIITRAGRESNYDY